MCVCLCVCVKFNSEQYGSLLFQNWTRSADTASVLAVAIVCGTHRIMVINPKYKRIETASLFWSVDSVDRRGHLTAHGPPPDASTVNLHCGQVTSWWRCIALIHAWFSWSAIGLRPAQKSKVQ